MHCASLANRTARGMHCAAWRIERRGACTAQAWRIEWRGACTAPAQQTRNQYKPASTELRVESGVQCQREEQ
eukprot:363526-Chlamydomonas_euryale.AAC.9